MSTRGLRASYADWLVKYFPTPRTARKHLNPDDMRLSKIDRTFTPISCTPQRREFIDRGDGQLLPTALLFRDNLLPGIDTRLGFQERPRAVVHPTLTFMPEFPEYLWGAVRGYVTARHVRVRVHFEEIAEPATDPPVSVMRITTAFGGWFVAEPQDGSLYVTVADAQRAVIRWMKETRTRPSLNEPTARLSRWVRLTDDDGTELEVEVWVWRGLTPLSASMENWVLHMIS